MSRQNLIPGLVPQKDGSVAMTIEVPNGNLKPEILAALQELGAMPGIIVHITTAQKIMLLGLDMTLGSEAMEKMEAAGAVVRKARTLSHARTCVGKPYCKYAWQDTFSLGSYLYEHTGQEPIARKLKIGIAGCPACCSWANITDMGFVGIKRGWIVFVGGHGGALPKTGTEITRITTQEEAVEITLKLARLFTENVKQKSRLDRIIKKLGGIDAVKKEIGID